MLCYGQTTPSCSTCELFRGSSVGRESWEEHLKCNLNLRYARSKLTRTDKPTLSASAPFLCKKYTDREGRRETDSDSTGAVHKTRSLFLPRCSRIVSPFLPPHFIDNHHKTLYDDPSFFSQSLLNKTAIYHKYNVHSQLPKILAVLNCIAL